MASNHIQYTFKLPLKKQKKTNFAFKDFLSIKICTPGLNRFLKYLNKTNRNHILNDNERIIISNKLTDIIFSWSSFTIFPIFIEKPVYKSELLEIYSDNISVFYKEIQNAIFDIQYDIQNILTKEDQKRIKRNQMKLKARAYSKQVVELEESLPGELLELFKKFIFVCNIRIENAVRDKILKNLDSFCMFLSTPGNSPDSKLQNSSVLKIDLIVN